MAGRDKAGEGEVVLPRPATAAPLRRFPKRRQRHRLVVQIVVAGPERRDFTIRVEPDLLCAVGQRVEGSFEPSSVRSPRIRRRPTQEMARESIGPPALARELRGLARALISRSKFARMRRAGAFGDVARERQRLIGFVHTENGADDALLLAAAASDRERKEERGRRQSGCEFTEVPCTARAPVCRRVRRDVPLRLRDAPRARRDPIRPWSRGRFGCDRRRTRPR